MKVYTDRLILYFFDNKNKPIIVKIEICSFIYAKTGTEVSWFIYLLETEAAFRSTLV